MAKPKLQIYPSLGTTFSVGWMRKDVPMVHVFAQAKSGEKFWPSDGHGGPHWPCIVCDYHGYTENDFHKEMREIIRINTN